MGEASRTGSGEGFLAGTPAAWNPPKLLRKSHSVPGALYSLAPAESYLSGRGLLAEIRSVDNLWKPQENSFLPFSAFAKIHVPCGTQKIVGKSHLAPGALYSLGPAQQKMKWEVITR